MIELHKLVNSPIPSNCFILIDTGTRYCIVIDPGSYDDNERLISFITNNNLTISNVILTHEHFDHISGVEKLHSKFQFELNCSRETASGIRNCKKNLSFFNDQMLPVNIYISPSIIKDNSQMLFANNILTFYNTPGHSPGSMCFSIDQYFFSGDTLLHEQKLRLNLPGSNKTQYKETIKRLKHIIKEGMQICPGHGICFTSDHRQIDISI